MRKEINRKGRGGRLPRVILSLCLMLICAVPAEAQQVGVSLSASRMPVRQAIAELEQQTGLKVGVSEHMDMERTVDFGRTSLTLDQAAGKIAGNDFSYTLYGDFILFNRRRRPVQENVGPEIKPIIIDDADLKKFVDYEKRHEGSYVTSLVYDGPRRLAVRDTTFPTPGDEVTGRSVPYPFRTAARPQRSKLMVKTNALYWATLTPNLQVEFGLGNRTTLNLAGSYNPWQLDGSYDDNKKLVHWIGLAELRYWFCERFSGHFIGVHALGSKFNISDHKVPLLFDKEFRYQGWGAGGGISYGYMFQLGRRWALELNAGAGVVRLDYDQYECGKCADIVGNKTKTYFGPTRLGVTFGYIIK